MDIRSLPTPADCLAPRSDRAPEGGNQKKVRSRNRLPGASRQLPDDGFHWLKYGHKNILGNTFSRAYYRCAQKAEGCPARKTVDFPLKDQSDLCVTYDGEHNHVAASSPIDPCHVVVRHKQQDDDVSLGPTPLIRHRGRDGNSIPNECLPGGFLPKWKVPPPPLSSDRHVTPSVATQQPEVPSWETSSEYGSSPASIAPPGAPWARAWGHQREHLGFGVTAGKAHPGASPLAHPHHMPLGLAHDTWQASTPYSTNVSSGAFPPWDPLGATSIPATMNLARVAVQVQSQEDSLSGHGSTEASSPGPVIRPIASRPARLLLSFFSDASTVDATQQATPESSFFCPIVPDTASTAHPCGGPSLAASARPKRKAEDDSSTTKELFSTTKRVLVSFAGHAGRRDQLATKATSHIAYGLSSRVAKVADPSDSESSNLALDLTLRL